MFRIGEFAQISQVSTRQLRFYEELGLLKPDHADPQTGYRFYSIRQLPRLNRILALKELGLSLEQIGSLLDKEISAAELRGMLTMKRAQIERALQEDQAQLRRIESRIAQIDRSGNADGFDVVTKAVAAMPILAHRQVYTSLADIIQAVRAVAETGTKEIRPNQRGKLIVVSHTDDETDGMDLEIGFSLTRATNSYLRINADIELRPNELPAVETMATIVRQGTNPESHLPYSVIGGWIEARGYEVTGPGRELFLEPVIGPPGLDKALVEIQFPVRPAA